MGWIRTAIIEIVKLLQPILTPTTPLLHRALFEATAASPHGKPGTSRPSPRVVAVLDTGILSRDLNANVIPATT